MSFSFAESVTKFATDFEHDISYCTVDEMLARMHPTVLCHFLRAGFSKECLKKKMTEIHFKNEGRHPIFMAVRTHKATVNVYNEEHDRGIEIKTESTFIDTYVDDSFLCKPGIVVPNFKNDVCTFCMAPCEQNKVHECSFLAVLSGEVANCHVWKPLACAVTENHCQVFCEPLSRKIASDLEGMQISVESQEMEAFGLHAVSSLGVCTSDCHEPYSPSVCLQSCLVAVEYDLHAFDSESQQNHPVIVLRPIVAHRIVQASYCFILFVQDIVMPWVSLNHLDCEVYTTRIALMTIHKTDRNARQFWA